MKIRIYDGYAYLTAKVTGQRSAIYACGLDCINMHKLIVTVMAGDSKDDTVVMFCKKKKKRKKERNIMEIFILVSITE